MQNLPNIVVLGSCSVDFTTYAPRLPKPGETLHGTKFTTSFGGKGANQCVAATKLGGNTYMICRLGDDQWGQKYKDHFIATGVNVDHVYITPKSTTGIAQISVADNGENQIVIVPGANSYLSVKDVENCIEVIKNAEVLIAQSETPMETTLEAFKYNKGIKLLNAAPAMKEVLKIVPYCTILCLNETEASILIDQAVNLRNVVIAVEKLLKYGCETVIITLGGDGAVYASKADPKPVHVPCEQVTPVDTTGAGDAFVGALAKYLVSEKLPLHQIIGAACYIATLSVTKEGTQTSYPLNVEAFSKEYKYFYL